jgi:hypothetical protein
MVGTKQSLLAPSQDENRERESFLFFFFLAELDRQRTVEA